MNFKNKGIFSFKTIESFTFKGFLAFFRAHAPHSYLTVAP